MLFEFYSCPKCGGDDVFDRNVMKPLNGGDVEYDNGDSPYYCARCGDVDDVTMEYGSHARRERRRKKIKREGKIYT
jgi:uncharacterized Zn finger protein